MKRLSLLLAVPSLMLSAAASADFYSHRYAGFSFGDASLDGFCEGTGEFIQAINGPDQSAVASGCSDNGDGWKIYGGWRWTPYLAFEGSFQQLAKSELDFRVSNEFFNPLWVEDEIETRLGNAFFVGHLPLYEGFSLFAKVGGGFWMSELTERQRGDLMLTIEYEDGTLEDILVPYSETVGDTASGFHWAYGAGISYRHHNRWTLRAEWESFSDLGSDKLRGEFDVQTASLGWSMHF